MGKKYSHDYIKSLCPVTVNFRLSVSFNDILVSGALLAFITAWGWEFSRDVSMNKYICYSEIWIAKEAI